MAAGRHPETAVFTGAVALALLAAALGAAPGPAALIAAAGLAAAAGLPHGALDPLAARQAGLARSPSGLALFLTAYTGLALGVIATWLAAPAAALAGFLLISAWHFGADWFEDRPWMRMAAGAGLLSLPAALHGPEVAAIYAVLSGEAARTIASAQGALAPAWLALILACAGLAARRAPRAAAEITMAGLAALFLHPLIFFALYFALLHSARHLLALWRAAQDRDAFVRTGVVYTAIAFAGAGLAAMVLMRTAGLEETALRVVFIGLAALTLPHMALIEWTRRRRAALRPA
ncbi:MAG: Brp/Blh family beta-carotene 15,15'-dioxygenase [Oceanicaulis sp.]